MVEQRNLWISAGLLTIVLVTVLVAAAQFVGLF